MKKRSYTTFMTIALIMSLITATLLSGCGSGSSGTAGEAAGTGTEASAEETGEPAEAAAETGEEAVEEAAEEAAEETAAEKTAYTAVEPAEAVVGLILRDAFDDDCAEYRETLLKELASKGFDREKVRILDCEDSGAAAAAGQLLEEGVDLLIVEAGDDKLGQEKLDAAIGEVADLAGAAFVPVIFLFHAPSEKEQLRWKVRGYAAAYVGGPGTGKDQAELINSLGRKNRDLDNDAVLRFVYVSEGTGRDKENLALLISALKKKGIRGECLAELKEGKGLEAALTDELYKHGKALELIVCSEDDIAEDIPEIARNADRTPGKNLVIIGADADEDVLKLILKGEVTGTVYRDVLTECRSAAQTAAALCAQEIPESTVVPGVSVTSANAQEIRDYRESFLKTD